MRRITKAQKLAQYDNLTRQIGVLQYYLWDMEDGKPADLSTQSGNLFMRGYRLTGAMGGYVVFKYRGNTPDVALLDDLIRRYQEDHHPATADMRICLEQIQVARNKLMNGGVL